MKKIVIAIDGYSACGKSTTAKAAARNLGYKFIDTGAMYRAVTLYFYQNHIEIINPKQVLKAMDSIQLGFVFNTKSGKNQITLNGLMVENEIRQMHISESVSEVSAVSEVRKDVISQQRQLGKKRRRAGFSRGEKACERFLRRRAKAFACFLEKPRSNSRKGGRDRDDATPKTNGALDLGYDVAERIRSREDRAAEFENGDGKIGRSQRRIKHVGSPLEMTSRNKKAPTREAGRCDARGEVASSADVRCPARA